MSNQYLKLRRSAVPGKVPTTSSIDFGEIALNTYDGLAFMKKSGSNGEEIVTLGTGTGGGLSGGLINRIPIWTSTGSLGNSDIFQTGSFIALHYTGSPEDPGNPELLYIHGGYIPTYNLISAHGNLDNYVQINIKNYSTGSSASGDIVVTADNGNENDKYVDLGINSSGFTNTSYVGGANDAYLYSKANDFYIGNASTGSQLILFNGGYDADANARVWIFDQGTVGINTNNYNNVNPPSLQIKAPNSSTYNLVQIEGNVNNYSQVGIVNRNSGDNASSDLVLYNNIDPDNQLSGYIDVGINSTNYISNSIYPGENGHAYVFTDSHTLILGTISGSRDEINLFTGGVNAEINSKLKLRANNIHSLTGSLTATQGFTGSLQGTASWAISSSYANSSSYAVTAWNIEGNDNVNSGSHFIGTKNLQPIVLKVNNQLAGLITARTGSAASTSGTVVIGQFAGQALGTNNGANTLIGHGAGTYLQYNPNKGNQNTFIGLWAGHATRYFSDPSGGRSVLVGQSTAFRNYNGSSLTYIGTFAGELNNQGNVNTGVGRDALRSNIDGHYNTAVGGLSLLYNTTGIKTITVVSGGLGYTTANVSISAPPAISPGVYQVTATATASISGGIITDITVIDPGGGYSLLTGSGDFHTGITVTITGDGTGAIAQVTETQSSTGNLGLGYAAGYQHRHGSYNIFMGYVAGGSFTTGSYNIIIGGNNGSSINGTNNNILISDGQGNERFRIPSTGNLLLATTVDRGYRLDVSGSGNFTNGLTVTGSLISPSITGSLQGTSSWAISASWAPMSATASYAINTISSSYSATASYVITAQTASYYGGNVISSSYALTASYALNGGGAIDTSSLVTTSSFNLFTASYNTGSFTGSFTGSLEGTASWAISASWAPTVGLTGGVIDYLAKWNDASTLITSSIFEDENGRYIIIGKSTPIRAGIVTGSGGQVTNTMFGYNNQISSSGYQNTSFGFGALQSNTSGFDNNAFGAFALDKNTQGINNTAFGRDALFNNLIGSYNTGIGIAALYDLTSGSYNTAIGRSSGRGITTGSYNTIIGAYQTGLPAGLTGHIIIGDGNNNKRLVVFDDGNVYIGATTILPVNSGYKLDVSGSGNFISGLTITGSLLLASSLYSFQETIGSAATTTTLVSISTGSYTAGFFDYTIHSGSNARAGTIMSVWNGSSVQYTDNSTMDIGSTNDVTMSVALSGGNITLRSTTTIYQWNIKTTYRFI